MPDSQVTLQAPPGETSVAKFPLVSIGLPVYNGARYVARALESLCAQDYPRIEIVCSDNASRDRTLEICEAYAKKYPFIRVHRQDRNVGVLKNFQTVLDLARGEYFMWAGADDGWEPAFVRRLVEEMEAHPEAALAMTAFERVHEDGTLFDVQRFVGKDSPNGKTHFSIALKLTSPLKFNLFLYGLFRREFIRKASRFFPDIPAWDRVFMTMVCLSAPIRCVDEILHRHGIHSIPLKERYPEEAVFRRKGGKDYRSLFWRTIHSIGATTLRSDLVPWHRKMFLLPACLFHYAWEVFKHRSRLSVFGLLKVFKRVILDRVRCAVKVRLQRELLKADAFLSEAGKRRRIRYGYWRIKRFALIRFWSVGKRMNQGLKTGRYAMFPGKVRPGKKKRALSV